MFAYQRQKRTFDGNARRKIFGQEIMSGKPAHHANIAAPLVNQFSSITDKPVHILGFSTLADKPTVPIKSIFELAPKVIHHASSLFDYASRHTFEPK